jgi:hypothetical protein
MKTFYLLFQFIAFASYAQKSDTISVKPETLRLENVRYGHHTYAVYFKKTKTSPSERMTLVKINVEAQEQGGRPVIKVVQQWDKDTVVHSAVTQFDPKNFSTLAHNTYWKRLGYGAIYDFVNKRVQFEGKAPDSVKTQSTKDFNDSFSKYNLNWHSDLVIFSLLPYKENRVFKINFYDPGFGAATEVFYRVEGSETLSTPTGKIDCWTLMIRHTKPTAAYQKFWVSKKTSEVLKEEDEFGGQYRYKLKLAVSEND